MAQLDSIDFVAATANFEFRNLELKQTSVVIAGSADTNSKAYVTESSVRSLYFEMQPKIL